MIQYMGKEAIERDRLLRDIRELQGDDAVAMFGDFPTAALKVHVEWLRRGGDNQMDEQKQLLDRESLLNDIREMEGPRAAREFKDQPIEALVSHVDWLRRGSPMAAANRMQPRGYGWRRIEGKD